VQVKQASELLWYIYDWYVLCHFLFNLQEAKLSRIHLEHFIITCTKLLSMVYCYIEMSYR